MLTVSPLDFVVVTGTRRWSDSVVEAVADLYYELGGSDWPGFVVVGCAHGVDEVAREVFPRKYVETAQWDLLGRIAGNIRNGAMCGIANRLIQYRKIGKGFAFPGPNSRGTWDCVKELKKIGMVVEIREIQ